MFNLDTSKPWNKKSTFDRLSEISSCYFQYTLGNISLLSKVALKIPHANEIPKVDSVTDSNDI